MGDPTPEEWPDAAVSSREALDRALPGWPGPGEKPPGPTQPVPAGRGGDQRIPRPLNARAGDPAPWADLPAASRLPTVAEVRAALAGLGPPHPSAVESGGAAGLFGGLAGRGDVRPGTAAAGGATRPLGTGAGRTPRPVGPGAGSAERAVGHGAGSVTRPVGPGAGSAGSSTRPVAPGAGSATRPVAPGAARTTRPLGAAPGGVTRPGAATGDRASRPSAVLAPLYDHPLPDGIVADQRLGAYVVLTRRTWGLRTHQGEVSFPGGRVEPGEEPIDAARREAQEEIGLDPSSVEVIGELDRLATVSSGSFIVPFVGVLPGRPETVPSPHEVEAVLHVPLADLLDPANFREERWTFPDGTERPITFFELVGDTVWGATASLLRQLLGVVTGTLGRGDLGHP